MGSKKSIWQVLVALLLIGTVLGGIFEFQPKKKITAIFKQGQTTRFRQVTGKVTKLSLENFSIEYTYTLGGQRYFSNQISFAANNGFSAMPLLEALNVGGDVTVYVNPSNDGESVLLCGLDAISCMPLWFGFAILFAGCCVTYSFIQNGKSIEAHRHDLQQQVRDDSSYDAPHIKRKRLVPGRFSPASVGVCCFFAGSVSVFVCTYFLGNWSRWWNIDLNLAILISVLSGAGMGIFDYYHTLNGNKRGRWDLIIDTQKGTLQVPANGAWGEPMTVPIESVLGVSRQLLFKDLDEKPLINTYQLQLHYRDFGVDSTHQFHTSTDTARLDALAEWIHEQVGITPSEESEGAFGSSHYELQTAQETNG